MNITVRQLSGSGASAQPVAKINGYPLAAYDNLQFARPSGYEAMRGGEWVSVDQAGADALITSIVVKQERGAYFANQLRQALLSQGAPMSVPVAQAVATGKPVATAAPQAGAATDNKSVAARIAAAAPLEAVDTYLRQFGPRSDLGEQTRREIFGSMLLELADQQNASLYDIAREFGLPANIAGSAGGINVGKFFKKAQSAFSQEGIGTIFREQVQNKIGEFIAGLGQSVLNISNDIPLFGKFFLKPLGFTSQAQILKQLGNVLKGGSINDFDEKAVGLEAASTFKEAGQALATAAPFLPPPWNVAAGALAGLSIAAGSILNNAIKEKEAARKAAEAEVAQGKLLKRAEVVVQNGISWGEGAADYYFGGKAEPAEPVLGNEEEMIWFAQAARFAFVSRANGTYGKSLKVPEAVRVVV